MRIYRIGVDGKTQIAVLCEDGRFYPVKETGSDLERLEDFWDDDHALEVEKLRQFVSTGEKKGVPSYGADEVEVYSPIEGPGQDVVCLGVNYYDHRSELESANINLKVEKNDTIYFSKRLNYAVGDGEKIPSHSDIVSQLDYEAELAVILGKDAYNVSAENAREYIFGYSVINDISARCLQVKHKQWYRGKSLDGFTAIGPCIVTDDEIADPMNLDISCTVNSELRQHSNTSMMIESIYEAIAELSTGMTLRKGTVIATGTPGGVGKAMNPPKFLASGDVVQCSIEHVGTLTNVID